MERSARQLRAGMHDRSRGNAVPVGTTPRVVPRSAVLGGLVGLLLSAGLVAASPAAAVDDPARPDARVTHGPSCRPGGVVVEVTAGTVPYAVRLATTRSGQAEDAAEVAPGQTVVLSTGDVDWGETIDSRLEYTALDGSGASYVDELEAFTFTRPAQEDCAAITAPSGPATVPPTAGSAPSSPQAGIPPVAVDPPPAPMPEVVPPPVPGLPATPDAGEPAPGRVAAASVSMQEVLPGDVVAVTGSGFAPGELVTLQLHGGAVLTSVTAGPAGQVHADVRIPGGAAVGPTALLLVGADSRSTAAVDLRIAAASVPSGTGPGGVPVPVLSAGLALLAVAAGLAWVAGHRAARADRRRPTGSG